MYLNYSVSFKKDNEWFMQRHHFHENIEILLSLTNAGSLFVEDSLYPLNRGTLMLLKNTSLHKTIANNCDIYSRYVIHFTEDMLSKISTKQSNILGLLNNKNHCIQLEEHDVQRLVFLLEQSKKKNTGQFGEDIKRSNSFIQFLIEVCILLKSKSIVGSQNSYSFSKVAPVIDYIRTHLNNDLSLNELANRFFISKYHLCRSFKSATGFNVGDYIINCRIIRAKELLRSGHSVQLAGELAGFNNNAHFIRTFGKLTGTSPGRYLKKYKQSLI